jgi:large-conductance mechanosensitive channel
VFCNITAAFVLVNLALGKKGICKLGYKIKHYAQPISTNVHSLGEVAIIEFSIGLICAGMAYWARDIVVQLFFGCLIVALMCFILTAHNIFTIVKTVRANKDLEKTTLKQTNGNKNGLGKT